MDDIAPTVLEILGAIAPTVLLLILIVNIINSFFCSNEEWQESLNWIGIPKIIF